VQQADALTALIQDPGGAQSEHQQSRSWWAQGGATSKYCRYNNHVRISYDSAKRDKTFDERGLDFEDAVSVFSGLTVEVEDTRKDYGERRILCYGLLAGRLVVVGYTPRGSVRHVFSMRKANDREQTRLAPHFGL
jgi:uncharacterized DUF497 family protein